VGALLCVRRRVAAAGSEEGSALAQLAVAWRRLRAISQREAAAAAQLEAAASGAAVASDSMPLHHLQLAERAFMKVCSIVHAAACAAAYDFLPELFVLPISPCLDKRPSFVLTHSTRSASF
jgi:hypothetical protein